MDDKIIHLITTALLVVFGTEAVVRASTDLIKSIVSAWNDIKKQARREE